MSPYFLRVSCLLAAMTSLPLAPPPLAAAEPTPREATDALHRAVRFFRDNCSAEGGYVYRWSADLSKREGEGGVGPTTAWIEPPGTPAVGMAYLEAYRLTKDPELKAAALHTADALLRGQLVSGGWDNKIEFGAAARNLIAYRVDLKDAQVGRRFNTTTFDDDKSQSAVRFLMQLDRTLEFSDPRIHEATLYALDAFTQAQYPNGAWPQRYSAFPKADEFPIRPASFAEMWSREFPAAKYDGFYTLNDNTISDLISTMLDAYDIYGDARYLAAAERGGDFFLRAQLPEPQPGWAQQYDRDMHPAWARKFEPPAITGGESQGVMQTLIVLYRRTGDKKFLAPIPRALEYYRSLQLPDGRLARFYELGTDRPLYFTKTYELTYSDADMPTHYGFQVGSRLDRIERDYQKWRETPTDKLWAPVTPTPPKLTAALTNEVRQIIDALDSRGAWVESGKMSYQGARDTTTEIIQSATFSKNIVTLSQFLAASRSRD